MALVRKTQIGCDIGQWRTRQHHFLGWMDAPLGAVGKRAETVRARETPRQMVLGHTRGIGQFIETEILVIARVDIPLRPANCLR